MDTMASSLEVLIQGKVNRKSYGLWSRLQPWRSPDVVGVKCTAVTDVGTVCPRGVVKSNPAAHSMNCWSTCLQASPSIALHHVQAIAKT